MTRSRFHPMQGLVCRALAVVLTGYGAASWAASAVGRLPFTARVHVLLPSGSVAGREVSIAQFVSHLDPDQALAQAYDTWRREPGSPVIEGTADAWRTLSRQERSGTVTIQIRPRPGGGSVGLISVWARESLASKPGNSDPAVDWASLLPDGSGPPRITSSRDGTRLSSTVVATHDASLSAVWSRLLARLGEQGFIQSRGLSAPRHMRQVRAAAFRRDKTDLVVTLDGRGDRVGIVMHLTEGQP